MRLPVALPLALLLALSIFGPTRTSVAAEPPLVTPAPRVLPSDAEILGPTHGWRIEALRLRFTYFDQYGHGYQSTAGPRLGPGSERVIVGQTMAQLEVRQSPRVAHTITVPVDIVSSASPNAIDAVTNASRQVEAGSIDVTTHYKHDAHHELDLRYGIHLEQPFRSWNAGLGYRFNFAEDNAQLGANVNQTIDWFDVITIYGGHHGRQSRSTSNANLAFSQILSTTTVAQLSYGYTFQIGQLSNTWNSVPQDDGNLGSERLPDRRHRHAFMARIAQYLPWRGALKALYRYYIDDFGLQAHTVEGQLYQYLGRNLYLRGTYRYYRQSQVDFFATRFPFVPDPTPVRTSDSDLARFDAHLYGGKLVFSPSAWQPVGWRRPELHIGYERYVRSNDLQVNIYSAGLSFRF